MDKTTAVEMGTDQDHGRTADEGATTEVRRPEPTWRPVAAGILELLASAPYFLASVMFYLFPTRVEVGSVTNAAGVTTPTIVQVWAPAGLVVWLPFALPLAVGGTCALLRRGWDLAFLGPIAPLALTVFLIPWGNVALTAFGSLFVFGWVPATSIRWVIVAAFFAMMAAALVLVMMSRKEFPKRRKPTAYRGFGPA